MDGSNEIFDVGKTIEFNANQISDKILKSTKTICSVCKSGDIRPERKPTPMILYTLEGVKIIKHQYMRCNFRAGTGDRRVECRAGHSYGFKSFKGMRIYEDGALKNDILVVSNHLKA